LNAELNKLVLELQVQLRKMLVAVVSAVDMMRHLKTGPSHFDLASAVSLFTSFNYSGDSFPSCKMAILEMRTLHSQRTCDTFVEHIYLCCNEVISIAG
jgi:hypothetical protein